MHTLQPLFDRGISAETLDAFGVHPVRDGQALYARYPIGEQAYKEKLLAGAGDKYRFSRDSGTAGHHLYGASFVPVNKRLILCEGEPDNWLLHTLRLPAISMLGGARTIHQTALDELAALRPPYVFVIYDHDEAGAVGSRMAARALRDRGIPCDALDLGSLGLPKGGDICDLYSWVGRDVRRMVGAIGRAKPLPIPLPAPAPTPRYSGPQEGKFAAFRAEHDIVAIAERITHLQKRGPKWVGRCPLGTHRDSSPSFTVWPEQGTWYCFGCGEHGDTYDLAQLTQRRATR